MMGPGFDAKTAAEFDKYLDPPELSELTEEELELAKIEKDDWEYEEWKDRQLELGR